MPSVRATIDTPVSAERLWSYLHDRYESPTYRAACRVSKGYIPGVARIESTQHSHLRFRVPSRDTLLNISFSSWTWSYDLRPTAEGGTQVTIEYHWPWALSLLSAGTARHQAANELVETVLAIDALAHDSR